VDEGAYIGGLIAGLAYLIMGVRLSRLGLRTGEAPERLLGVTFLVWGVSYLLWALPIALSNEAIAVPCFAAGRLLNDIGVLTSALFMRLVFRSRERWAQWLVAGVALGLLVGLAGSISVGDWAGFDPFVSYWWWLERSAAVVSVLWISFEGFSQYRMARQRLRLDLCDPLVCNRYLLWGVVGATWTTWEVAAIVQSIEYEITQVWSATMDSLVGGLEIAAIALIGLVFFPPAVYRHWINRVDVADAAGGR
jgi:hypothetical protein